MGAEGLRLIQIHHSNDINTNVLVFFNGTRAVFNVDDCVRIIGSSDKPQDFTNPFGAVLTTLSINAQNVEKIDCSLAINPSIRTVFVQQIQQQDGIMVKLSRVDFAEQNTRAHVEIQNTGLIGDDDIHFYEADSIVTKGANQFVNIPSFDVSYPTIESNIPPEIEESGVVLFEPMDYKTGLAKFIFPVSKGFTSGYEFTFNVNLSDNANNNSPEYFTYENLDHRVRISCPVDWDKWEDSDSKQDYINFGCTPRTDDLQMAVFLTAVPRNSSDYRLTDECMIVNTNNIYNMRQCFSSLSAAVKNQTTNTLLNSSYTSIMGRPALQLTYYVPNENIKFLNTYTILQGVHLPYEDYYYEIISFSVPSEYDKFLSIIQKIRDSFQPTYELPAK